MTPFAYRADVHTIADQHGLDPNLVEAVVMVESNGRTDAFRFEPAFWVRYLQGKPEWAGENPRRVSSSYGLCQVMYPVAVEHGMPRSDPPESLFVPVIGLTYGCRVLRANLTWAKGDVRAALAAYNGGKVGNAPGVQPKRNEAYVMKVMRQLAVIQKARKQT